MHRFSAERRRQFLAHSIVNETNISRPSRWIWSVTGAPGLSSDSPAQADERCRLSLLKLRMMSRGSSGISATAPAARAATTMP